MKVLVDTSVWSLALRRDHPEDLSILNELKELIKELRVNIIGPIRQELLFGILDEGKFHQLKDKLSPFEDLLLDTGYYEYAAELSNTCRKHGIQGSHTDFLICSVAIKKDLSIFTLDQDFEAYRKHINIKLHAVRNELK